MGELLIEDKRQKAVQAFIDYIMEKDADKIYEEAIKEWIRQGAPCRTSTGRPGVGEGVYE